MDTLTSRLMFTNKNAGNNPMNVITRRGKNIIEIEIVLGVWPLQNVSSHHSNARYFNTF